MLKLRTFGGLALEGENGLPPGSSASRRSLALLALLAASGNEGLSRDKILGYLWPESDTERARHALAQSLYALRRELKGDLQGEDPVLAGAGDTLKLNPGQISVDVAEFEAALGRGDLEGAVALYRGPFLDGFYLSNAPEFERWVEARRAQLATKVSDALESLAAGAAARGDHRGATDFWRRLATLDRLNSRVALGLMKALAASGDRAGALRHARIHQALLASELDAAPDAAVADFVARLRAEPEGVGAPQVVATATDQRHAAAQRLEDARPAHPDGQVVSSSASTGLPPVAPPVPKERAPTQRRHSVVWATSLLIVLSGAATVWHLKRPAAAPVPPPTAIAVLPFADLSPGKDNEYLGDGMTEELINALARVDGLRVAARTSSFALKGKDLDVRTVGDTLDVATVLEGSVQKVGSRLRVFAQLIDAKSGYHLWSETYERELEDVFAVQDQITKAIVGALRVRLASTPTAQHLQYVKRPTGDLEAYELYLRGRYFWNKRTGPALRTAVRYFEQAIEKDPKYAQAYAGLADVYMVLGADEHHRPHDALPKAKAAAYKALELDSTLAGPHAVLGMVKARHDFDWIGAEREFKRAIALDANHASGHHGYALMLANVGRTDEAMRELAQARDLDPLGLSINQSVGVLYFCARQYDRAIEQALRTLELEPALRRVRLHLARAYRQKGMLAEALNALEPVREDFAGVPAGLMGNVHAVAGRRDVAAQILARLEDRVKRGEYISPVSIALVHIGLGDADRALRWLERAYEERAPQLIWLKVDPIFDPLRSDPRFTRLLRRIGLEP
jgi:adenylate cyclase